MKFLLIALSFGVLSYITFGQEIDPDQVVFEEASYLDVVEFPDVEAQFVGGVEAFRAYILDSNKISLGCMQENGTVYIRFIVEKDGSISAPEIVRGVNVQYDNEALRLIKEMPNWIPAKCDDVPCRTIYQVPIKFEFN